jgi:hypothetical protein
MQRDVGSECVVWGDYPNWDDISRFEYGRRLWRLPDMRARLLVHWLDERHPHRERFQNHRALVEEILSSPLAPEQLDEQLRARRTSLRCVAREIPPVFGSSRQRWLTLARGAA